MPLRIQDESPGYLQATVMSPRPSSLSSDCSSFISSRSLLNFVYLKLFCVRSFLQFCQHHLDVFSVISSTLFFLLRLTHQFRPVPSNFLLSCPCGLSNTVISVCPSQVRSPALSLFLPTPPHVSRPHSRFICPSCHTHLLNLTLN